jgi:hypothetical protein
VAGGRRLRADEERAGRLPRAVSAATARRPALPGAVSAARARRLVLSLGAAALLAIGAAACGQSSNPIHADANNNGFYVDAGHPPITYQLQISRELNPYSLQDREYLIGVNSAPLNPDQEWFGVFLWAKNQTKSPVTTANSFDIIDTQGNIYYPVQMNPLVNLFAWTPVTLQPNGTYPIPGTTASYTPPQGALLLFKINTSAYANRPLTLEIHAAGQQQPSTISLNL